jgi:hypothetical protein
MKLIGLPSIMLLWRKHQKVLIVCGLTSDAVRPSFCFRTDPSILENRLMVIEEPSSPCILLCFLAILCLEVSHCYSMFLDPASVVIG